MNLWEYNFRVFKYFLNMVKCDKKYFTKQLFLANGNYNCIATVSFNSAMFSFIIKGTLFGTSTQ